MAVDASIVAVITQALVILFIGFLLGKKFSFESAIANGVIVLFAGGTLLFHTKALGFMLLAYGAAIMIAAMEERDIKKFKGSEGDILEYIVFIFGNYIVTAFIIILVAMISYNVWPFTA